MKKYDYCSLQLLFLLRTTILNEICCYNLQSSFSTAEKDRFCKKVFSIVAPVQEEEMLVLGDDFNGHVGEHRFRGYSWR